MIITPQTQISKDVANKKVTIIREFIASIEEVWNAWTESELLDMWWAPKPWKAKTKTMDFKEGGVWLYCMVGPDGDKNWCRVDFKTIVTHKTFTAVDEFCDEEGNRNSDLPGMHWHNKFSATGSGGTTVTVVISFKTEADLEKIMELGFEEGFTAAHGNLDELLAK